MQSGISPSPVNAHFSDHPATAPSGSGGVSGLRGLRVAVVGPVPPPAGGMANQTRQLTELLRSAGGEVTVVATTLPYRPAWTANWRGLRAGLRLVQYLGRLWRAMGQVQVVHLMANSGWSWHLFAVPAIWVAVLRGVPVVVNYRGGEAGPFLQSSARLVRWSMRRAAALVVPSGFLDDVFRQHGMAARQLPNIVDLQRFAPAQGREPGHHVVVARNLEPIYDNASAVRALAALRRQVPDATLTIAGSGPERPRLEGLVAELGLAHAVRFTGQIDRDQMADLYRSADVLLNTSLVDNMPNSLLEALACGVPVVSTRVGGVPYMVEHERTALLVPPAEPEQMAQAVARVLLDRALWQQLSAAGLNKARLHAWPQVAGTLTQIYRQAMEARA